MCKDRTHERDVIVVGDGPAGASAAKAAAAQNVDVLLLEKYPTIMANKPCGEAVSKETLVTAGVKPSPRIVMHEAYALVYSPSMIEVEIPQIGYNINKTLFIRRLKNPDAVRSDTKVMEPKVKSAMY